MSKGFYIVELREYTDSGDYIEFDAEFDTKEEAIKYAKENKNDLFDILEYKNGRTHTPKSISI